MLYSIYMYNALYLMHIYVYIYVCTCITYNAMFVIILGQHFFSPLGLRKIWAAVRHANTCRISLRIFLEWSIGSQFLRKKYVSPNHASINCISNLNMKIVLNGPLVEALELPIGNCCVNFRPGSNGTTPGPQNQIKNTKKT